MNENAWRFRPIRTARGLVVVALLAVPIIAGCGNSEDSDDPPAAPGGSDASPRAAADSETDAEREQRREEWRKAWEEQQRASVALTKLTTSYDESARHLWSSMKDALAEARSAAAKNREENSQLYERLRDEDRNFATHKIAVPLSPEVRPAATEYYRKRTELERARLAELEGLRAGLSAAAYQKLRRRLDREIDEARDVLYWLGEVADEFEHQ